MSTARSPFKFLDSYQKADVDVFFGREEETKALYKALSGVKQLLVYGSSGSGKTSLVECGLRNQFSDADWFALTIRRGANINASVFTRINNALDIKIKIDPVSKMPEDKQTGFAQAVEKLFAKRYQPLYLLFDQFEELLISGETEEKKIFFTGLNNLINYKVPCRIMLIMREEFIGHLSEFEPLCPTIFQHRYRVEKMGRKNVEEVIYHILEAQKYKTYFKVEDSQKLAETILSKLPDKRKEIELAHVQVFLGELWDRAQSTTKNHELPVLSANLIHDDDNLEGVLESFLKKQMTELEVSYGKRIPLELLAAMISERFTKLQLSEAAIKADLERKKVVSEKPIADLLKELEQRRIVRTIKIGDETQYEISHDVLALVVGQNLTDEMKMREKAEDIYKVYQDEQGLLTQKQIDNLRPYEKILSYPPELQTRIDESITVIKKNRDEELAKTRKRLRTVYSLLGGALLALFIAGYFGIKAHMAKKEAENQAKIAHANFLVSEAKSVVISDPTLALRLTEQAMMTDKNPKIKNAASKIYAENNFYKIIGSHKSLISSLAYSPDGKKILTGSWDHDARLWDLNGDTIQKFSHSRFIKSVTFSPDGNLILTGSADSTARLWDLKGNLIRVFKGHSNGVTSVAFSPPCSNDSIGGKTILTGSEDGTARIWDIDGNLKHIFNYHSDEIWSVAFSPDGKKILTCSKDKTFILWDIQGNLLQQFKSQTGYIFSAIFSPNGKTILTCSEDNSALLWDLKGNVIQNFKGHTDKVVAAIFSPDGKTILSASYDNTTRLWDLKGNTIQEFKGHTGKILSIAFSPDGKKFITGSYDNTFRLWKLKGNIIQEFMNGTSNIYSVAFSPDGKTILTGLSENTAILWDLKGNMLHNFKGHINKVVAVAFSCDGEFILTGSWDKTARLWKTNGKFVQEFKGHTGEILSVAFSPDGKTILTGSEDSKSILWDLKGRAIDTLNGHSWGITSVAFSPDGNKILTGSKDRTALLWDLEGDSIQRFTGHDLGITSVAFSPDGKTILTGSWDKTTRFWNLTGDSIQIFSGHNSGVSSVAFSPLFPSFEGSLILTAFYEEPACLQDKDGNPLQLFKYLNSYVTSFAFSPDGNVVLTCSSDKAVRLWNSALSLNEFLSCDIIEPLSPEQRKMYGIK